ncbi:MAG: hypothetical protein IJ455_09235 [Agathobacter sp.]|nr:hypothetical protein [Agathobacter sp.]
MKLTQYKEKIKAELDKLTQWIKLHPSGLIWMGIGLVLVVTQNYIIGLCFSPVEIFSMESMAQVLGTSAEVVAGLYGLTLTGYIFFQDRLQQKADNDDLLEDIITLLKKRYHNMVLILSGICFAVILVAFNFIIYQPDSGIFPMQFYYFWGYEALFLVFLALVFNIYFIITVVDPDKIPRASLQYKQKLSNSDAELGSLQGFLQDYEDIEQLLIKKSEGIAVSHLGTNPWKALKHLNGKEKLEIRKIVSDPLLINLSKLSQYYSYMVFSQEMTVTKEMCDLAKKVKQELSNLG